MRTRLSVSYSQLPGLGKMFAMKQFFQWEATTRDTIDFKCVYADMAGGDVLAGLALSEIVYWHLPKRNGESKMSVVHDGKEWIAVRRYEWWERTRMTPRQADRVLAALAELGLIEKAVYKWYGEPTTHVRIVEDTFMKAWNAVAQHPTQNPFSPHGENEVTGSAKTSSPKTSNPVTKTTTETTSKSASQETLSGEPNCAFILDTQDQYPHFREMNTARKKEARFNCPECGAKGSIGILDRVSPCCNCRIDWRNNDILAKKLKAEAADEEAKYRRSQVAKNLTPGAKHLLTQAIGTDPQGRCQYKPGEAARVAAFEQRYGVELIQTVTSEKMDDGKVGRGLIVAVINALPFAAEGKPIVEPESTEVIDSEKYALPD